MTRPVASSVEELVIALRTLGVQQGDHVMVHASLRAIGPVDHGAAGVVIALDRAVGDTGTLLMTLGTDGVAEWAHVAPDPAVVAQLTLSDCFDTEHTPATPENGFLAEEFRRTPGTRSSTHPEGRFGARGRLARELLERCPWHDYYGKDSPLERLVNVGGKILRLGADTNTVTLLHYAEYLTNIEPKRRVTRYVAVRGATGPEVARVDTIDDSDGIVEWHGDDYFHLLLKDYLATGAASIGTVGHARSELIDARDLVRFGVPWMETHLVNDSL
jgi:aminoglycoside N3'-acetyltransferase